MAPQDQLIEAARELASRVDALRFSAPVTHVYNPLIYAWDAHQMYLRQFGGSGKEAVFLGMNPGPFGMAQTGVPFGEISAVRDWMKIQASVERPGREHPRRPILGFDCLRSEISGKRLWGLFQQRFGPAEDFFARHFVVNYCPLAFIGTSGRNITPDRLAPAERKRLERICNAHLRRVLEIIQPKWVVGVGDFAARRAELAVTGLPIKIGRILHPSPACPAANRDWAGQVTRQLQTLGVWQAEAV